ncbi:hypothetical protein DIS24_g12140 [Lasiodiplodia hormozganensis]|uniref:Uncharacterized protein n=1 Tax=Lasiodiplodia hormozganensis TaxID=869390 RepID=A0AA39WBM7_9PEZI|nr:hypothetical protein DIS24_g12140 [Lasiodiplodia hormozganensis]
MADRRPKSPSNDRVRLPRSNAGERDETSSSPNSESRTRTPAIAMPMSSPTQAYVPQPHAGRLINTSRNPAPTDAPNSSQQHAAKDASLITEIVVLNARIAALESESAKLKAKNARLETKNVNLQERFDLVISENEALIDIGAKVYQLSPWFNSEPLDCPKLIKEWRAKLVASLGLAHEVLAGCLAGGYILPKGLPSHLVPAYKTAMALSKSLPDMLGLTERDVGRESSPNIADYATSSDGDDSSDSDYSYSSQSDIEIDSESESDSGTFSGNDSGNDGMEETPDEVTANLLTRHG